jgi:hypothetical protein
MKLSPLDLLAKYSTVTEAPLLNFAISWGKSAAFLKNRRHKKQGGFEIVAKSKVDSKIFPSA